MNKFHNKRRINSCENKILKKTKSTSNINSVSSAKSVNYNNNNELFNYKKYFKTYIKYKKLNANYKTHLNKMYIQYRNKYQNFVTKNKNNIGLKFKGNKIYENLPLNIFKDNYMTNTFNISNELKEKVLGYFYPKDNKEKDIDKLNEGKKIKLTPIPFKNNILINSIEEKNNIQEAKRSAVLMRRVEYTHLIKNNKSKNFLIEENNDMNLSEKICIIKGAILIIEDWWKKIKFKKSIKKRKKNSKKKKIYQNDTFSEFNSIINFLNGSNNNSNKKEKFTNLKYNKIRKSNKLIKNNSYYGFNFNSAKIHKKQNELQIQNNYIINSNKYYKNINNLRLSNNNNNSTALNSKSIINSYKSNEEGKNLNPEFLIKITEIEKNENNNKSKENNNDIKKVNNLKLKLNKNNKKRRIENKNQITANEKFNKNNINKNEIHTNKIINNDIRNKVIISSLNQINKINFDKYTKRNKKSINTSEIHSTTNETKNKTNKENNKKIQNYLSFNNINNHNNIKLKNHLKEENISGLKFNFEDIEKLNKELKNTKQKTQNVKNKKDKNISHNVNTPKTKQIENSKLSNKSLDHIYNITNYDRDRKNTAFSKINITICKSCEIKRKNYLEKILLYDSYKTVNNTELNLTKTIIDNNVNENNKKIHMKYIESKENDIQISGIKIQKDENIENKNNNNNIEIQNINTISFNKENKKNIESNNIIQNIHSISYINKNEIKYIKKSFIIKNNNRNNINILKSYKKYKTFSKQSYLPSQINNNKNKTFDNNDTKAIKEIKESINTNKKKNKNKKINIIYKNEYFSLNKKIINNKKFEDLNISLNNKISFLNDLNKKQEIKNNNNKHLKKFNYELKIISNKDEIKKEINNELIIEEKESLLIKNTPKKIIPLKINKLEIEINNNNLDDSDITPIEQDEQNIINFENINNNDINNNINNNVENDKINQQLFFSNFSFEINPKTKKSNNLKKNLFINDINYDYDDVCVFSSDRIHTNSVKTENFQINKKINDLFSSKISKNIINNNNNKKMEIKLFSEQKEIKLKPNIKTKLNLIRYSNNSLNESLDKSNKLFPNKSYNNINIINNNNNSMFKFNKLIRSENDRYKIYKNDDMKKSQCYIYTNIKVGVPKNVEEAYKLYKPKKKNKEQFIKYKANNFEFLRTLHAKYYYE